MITFKNILQERAFPQVAFEKWWSLAKHVKLDIKGGSLRHIATALYDVSTAYTRIYKQVNPNTYAEVAINFIGFGAVKEIEEAKWESTGGSTLPGRLDDTTVGYRVEVNVLFYLPMKPEYDIDDIDFSDGEGAIDQYVERVGTEWIRELNSSWSAFQSQRIAETVRHEFIHVDELKQNKEPLETMMTKQGKRGFLAQELGKKEYYYSTPTEVDAYANMVAKWLSDKNVSKDILNNPDNVIRVLDGVSHNNEMWRYFKYANTKYGKHFWKIVYQNFDRYEKEKRKYAL